MRLLVLLLSFTPAIANAQSAFECVGQKWDEIATRSFHDERLGPIVAMFNDAHDLERCEVGKFVRLPLTIRHELVLGQTIRAVAERFLRAPGGEASIREHNHLASDVDPPPGTVLEIPSELAIRVGTRPEAELAQISGLPDLATIRRYNGFAEDQPISGVANLFVPIFLSLKAAPPPPVATTSTSSKVRITVDSVATIEGFRHRDHREALAKEYACELCHRPEVAKAHTYRPIASNACTTCHREAQIDVAPPGRPRQLTLAFSHALHLDPEQRVARGGYRLECANCHPSSADETRRERPAHPVCIKCHNPSEAKPAVASDCAGCHGEDEQLDRLLLASALLDEHYRMSVRGDDVVFSHADHDEPCERCHLGARAATSLDELEPMRMSDCMNCHRGLQAELAEASVTLDRCRTCHVERTAAAPSFGSLVEKPLSHTRAFRVRHGREAERDRGTCNACHLELAGGDGARCDRCHSRIAPEDHSVRWREEPHGRAAARDPDRCATCHLRDRCASCHAIAPRDHAPRSTFILRHGLSARTSTRRCLTCHLPQVDCTRCHNLGVF